MNNAQAATAIQNAIDQVYKTPGEQMEVFNQAQQALAILTMTTDEQRSASETLRAFIDAMADGGTLSNPRQAPEALAALDILSGESSQESLRASLEDELNDALTNVLDTHDVNDTNIRDMTIERAHAIVARIENRNIRLDPETF